MIRIEDWTGLGGSTQRLHQKEIGMLDILGVCDEEPFSTRGK